MNVNTDEIEFLSVNSNVKRGESVNFDGQGVRMASGGVPICPEPLDLVKVDKIEESDVNTVNMVKTEAPSVNSNYKNVKIECQNAKEIENEAKCVNFDGQGIKMTCGGVPTCHVSIDLVEADKIEQNEESDVNIVKLVKIEATSVNSNAKSLKDACQSVKEVKNKLPVNVAPKNLVKLDKPSVIESKESSVNVNEKN